MKPKTLLLTLAVTAALAACQKDAPAPSADAKPAAPAPTAMELPPTSAFAIADLDTNADVCTDLDAFVNGKWLAANPVPSDRTTWGSFEMLDERSEVASRNIAEAAAADANASGVAKLVGDFYATGMDEAAVNAAGLAPIQPILDRIDAIASQADIVKYLQDEFVAGAARCSTSSAKPITRIPRP